MSERDESQWCQYECPIAAPVPCNWTFGLQIHGVLIFTGQYPSLGLHQLHVQSMSTPPAGILSPNFILSLSVGADCLLLFDSPCLFGDVSIFLDLSEDPGSCSVHPVSHCLPIKPISTPVRGVTLGPCLSACVRNAPSAASTLQEPGLAAGYLCVPENVQQEGNWHLFGTSVACYTGSGCPVSQGKLQIGRSRRWGPGMKAKYADARARGQIA